MALGTEDISGGRMALNIVNGWDRDEADRTGLVFLDHDERYGYGAEWLTIVSSVGPGARPRRRVGRPRGSLTVGP
jgi:alkanesulfonate monooxygenase